MLDIGECGNVKPKFVIFMISVYLFGNSSLYTENYYEYIR